MRRSILAFALIATATLGTTVGASANNMCPVARQIMHVAHVQAPIMCPRPQMQRRIVRRSQVRERVIVREVVRQAPPQQVIVRQPPAGNPCNPCGPQPVAANPCGVNPCGARAPVAQLPVCTEANVNRPKPEGNGWVPGINPNNNQCTWVHAGKVPIITTPGAVDYMKAWAGKL